MKVLVKSHILLLFLLIAFGCDREETFIAKKGSVSFVIHDQENAGGRKNEQQVPDAIILSIVDINGKAIVENKKLALLQFGQGFISENLELAAGNYKLTKFFVLTASNKIIYATPLENAEKASEVNDALPLLFDVNQNANLEVVPQVLVVTSGDMPQNFGYTSFGFEVADKPETIDARVKVELHVGDIDYLDVNTKILVSGFDSLNVKQWSEEFAYVGPSANDLSIKGEFHHYTFEIQQWGIYDKQIINQGDLWQNRADGPAPVTYVLGGSIAAKKVTYYINYMEMPDTVNPGSTYMAPQHKVAYEYNASGKIDRMTFYSYSGNTNQFTPDRYFLFSYLNGRVDNIAGYYASNNTLYIDDFYYYYNNGNVSKIIEKNYGTGINSEVNVTYNYTDRIINAAYTFSNGGSFEYSFFYNWKNIVTEKTTKGAQLCSEGGYTYDKNINPLKHLGYVDFLFRNFSVNNKLSEDITYKACGFPTLVPESYSYEYDAEGYPKTAITHYSSGTKQLTAQTTYFYQ